jgi:uncharacterized membrane protein YphA (DoxX/SURF4 family)
VLQLVLAAVFLYSAVTKFADIFTFGEILRSYELLPDALIKPLAILLPLVEVLVALGLLFSPTATLAAYGVALLSLFFGIILLFKWGEVMPYGCGCFGPTEAATVGFLDVGKDVVLLLAASAVIWMRNRRKRIAN